MGDCRSSSGHPGTSKLKSISLVFSQGNELSVFLSASLFLNVGASLIARRILAISPPDAIDRTGRSGALGSEAKRKMISSKPPLQIK